MKKLFEGNASRLPTEMLVKAAAEGDTEKIDVLCNQEGIDVSVNPISSDLI